MSLEDVSVAERYDSESGDLSVSCNTGRVQ
jgi:hypothetical protein